MKKTVMFIFKFISVTAAFFTGCCSIFLMMVFLGADFSEHTGMIIIKLLLLSVLYAISSPISFSVKHFIKYSMMSRLLIQTSVNYPILIVCTYLFGWMVTDESFYKITTVYFFAGMAAAMFICLYYPRKYKLYNERLKSYKKRALTDKYPYIS